MRREFLRVAAALITPLFLVPAAGWSQAKAPEVIRGMKKEVAGQPAEADPGSPPRSKHLQPVSDQAAKASPQDPQGQPASAEAYYRLGLAQVARGELEEAVKSFQGALRLKPNYPQARVSLAEIYGRQGLNLLRQGNPAAAEGSLKEALQLNPKDDAAMSNLGAALGQQGRWGEALTSLKVAVNLNPNNTKAQFNLGVVAYSMGDKEAATQQYAILTALDPESATELFKLIQGTSEVATPFRF